MRAQSVSSEVLLLSRTTRNGFTLAFQPPHTSGYLSPTPANPRSPITDHRKAMDGMINIEKSQAVDLLLANHQWLREWETLALAHPNQVASGAARLPEHIKHWWTCGDNFRPPSWPRLLQLYRNPPEARTGYTSIGLKYT